jgi:hypothetical protein
VLRGGASAIWSLARDPGCVSTFTKDDQGFSLEVEVPQAGK